MNEKCLFIIPEKGKWGIQKHLKPLGAIYNGVGWFIEIKHKDTAAQLCQQANMRITEWPLNGETFDELKRRNKSEFLQVKSIEKSLAIDALKAALEIKDFTNEDLKKDEQRIKLEAIQEGKKLIENIEEYDHLQEQLKQAEEEEKISKLSIAKIPIVPISKRIESHKEALKKYRGKKYLGLCVKTIDEFNEKMLGLRKLILLAAAPNVGKTALTIQLAQEVLIKNPDACLVYISLEMDAEEIFTRMNLYLSELNFHTYVLGSEQKEGENGNQNLFSEEELRKIENATKEIERIGDRLQIIDMSSCANLNAEIIIKYVENLKSKTGCTRAIVVIDYLQVWPIPPKTRFTSDIEADKWRIGEIKKIRDALNEVNQDPVIVISEARKPSESGNMWAGDLADVMGSARGTYTPDAVLLLNPLSTKQVNELWKKNEMPEIDYKSDINDLEDQKEDSKIKDFLAHHGIAICSLKMPKGRDGMKKFNILLAFHFHKNKFEKINWLNIRILAQNEKKSSSQKKNYDDNGNEIICKL